MTASASREPAPAGARRATRIALLALLPASLASCGEHTRAELPAETATVSLDQGGPLRPVVPALEVDRRRAELGSRLFHDPGLSHDGSLACASCHPLARGGMDGLARSRGISGQVEARNTPTVFNAAVNFRQFWDGRADSLESQVESPLTSPSEMASTWPEIIGKLGADKAYRQAFDEGYADGLTVRNVRDAIATFERTLIVTGSPFDRFLMGDASALSRAERRGYDLFRSVGCVSCHQGANVGGNMYERLGVIQPYFDRRPAAAKADLGRFAVTGRKEDRFVFRVPSLRFVALTAPYLHDGSIATLADTIRLMATHQLGRTLSQDDVDNLARFLHSLAGRFPE